jgi:hypothetical protein
LLEEALDPVAMLAVKGYDSDAIQDNIERRGIEPVSPTKSSRDIQHPLFRHSDATAPAPSAFRTFV